MPFFYDRLSVSHDNILQKSLFITLQSVEIIALLRVLSILHISVCLQTRWLSGNVEDLAKWDFGVLDMGDVVDTLEAAMEEIAGDGKLMLNEDFVMNIFSKFQEKIDPFDEYLAYIFEEKLSNPIGGSTSVENKVIPFDLLRAELFYPTRMENRQTHQFCCRLAEEIASTILAELRDPRKATSQYLSSCMGKYSKAVIAEDDRQACMGKLAHNSMSESGHAMSTSALIEGGMITLYHAAAQGQARANADFVRGHDELIGHSKGASVKTLGTFHSLPLELRDSLIAVARENVSRTRKFYDDALERQRAARQRKEEIMMERKLGKAQEEFIVAIYFYEQYHSPRCWVTTEKAMQEYGKIKSDAQKLKAVKEQILIRYLGLGWEKAHHPWSQAGKSFTPSELFQHLINVVIPLAEKLEVPSEPPLTLPAPPDLPVIGTKASIDMTTGSFYADKLMNVKKQAYKERDAREAQGKGDRWSEMQEFNAPEVNSDLVGFNIEMLFEYPDDDGGRLTNWYNGEVISIVNEKKSTVRIKWDPLCLGENDEPETVEQLLPMKWNQNNAKPGVWRQYLSGTM